MEAMYELLSLAGILLVGIVCNIIAKRLKISGMLLLLLAGISMSKIQINGGPLLHIPLSSIAFLSTFLLIVIVFERASEIKLHSLDTFSRNFRNQSFLVTGLTILLLTFGFVLLVPTATIFIALIFACMMSGTIVDSAIVHLKSTKSAVRDFLKEESNVNTLIAVILPFIFLKILWGTTNVGESAFSYSSVLLKQIIVGVGIGILVGILMFRLLHKHFSEHYVSIVMVTSAIVTYVFSELLEGSGVLSVAVFGLFVGNMATKEKEHLQKFSFLSSECLQILMFVLLGYLILLPVKSTLIVESLLLFFSYLLIRFLGVCLVFGRSTKKERMLMTLTPSKGIALAGVILTLLPYVTLHTGLDIALKFGLLFMLYNLVISTIAARFA